MAEETEGTRLQKVLAAAGIASRRASEILIDEGRVEVNGKVVTEQGRRVNPETDQIRVDGSRIPPPRRHLSSTPGTPVRWGRRSQTAPEQARRVRTRSRIARIRLTPGR